MPKLVHIETTTINAVPPTGSVITFFVEENGKIVLKVKNADGTVVAIMKS